MQQLSLTTTTLVGLLFFSVALGHSLALARRGVFMFADSEKVHQNNQEIHDKTSMIEDSRSKQMNERIGIGNIIVEAKKTLKEVELKQTQSKSYPSDSNGSPNLKDSSSTTVKSRPLSNFRTKIKGIDLETVDASDTPQKGFRLSAASTRSQKSTLSNSHKFHDQTNRNIRKQKLIEASDEIFRLLNKDYHDKPRRRPPVNN
uniref:Uncharacterized protein n=1 Tax=Ananas comosus var. bracteatus TaxID=296719 RepID=A0A6V7NWW5_ANACO|nr:unnamed protein product [Ananas comosus var. bracteatus]